MRKENELPEKLRTKLNKLDFDCDYSGCVLWFQKTWIFAYEGYREPQRNVITTGEFIPGDCITTGIMRAKQKHKLEQLKKQIGYFYYYILELFIIDQLGFGKIGGFMHPNLNKTRKTFHGEFMVKKAIVKLGKFMLDKE